MINVPRHSVYHYSVQLFTENEWCDSALGAVRFIGCSLTYYSAAVFVSMD